MTPAGITKRMALIEQAAMRLLPRPEPDVDSPRWVCGRLTGNELDRLAHVAERAESGEAVEGLPELWADLRKRALARALLDVDMAKLDEQERAGRMLLTFDHPDHPGDRLRVIYVDYTEDLVERGVWHISGGYRAQHPELPAELTAAELALRAPRPWPPRPQPA
jgi:hypothetical protein